MSLRFVPPHLHLSNTHPSPSFLQNYPFLENEARFVPRSLLSSRSRDTKSLPYVTARPLRHYLPNTYLLRHYLLNTYLLRHCLGLGEVCAKPSQVTSLPLIRHTNDCVLRPRDGFTCPPVMRDKFSVCK